MMMINSLEIFEWVQKVSRTCTQANKEQKFDKSSTDSLFQYFSIFSPPQESHKISPRKISITVFHITKFNFKNYENKTVNCCDDPTNLKW